MPLKPQHLSKSTLLSISIAINIISLLAISAFAVKAGSLSPSGSPAGTMYSLSDIYTRLTTNAAATEGNHTLSSSASVASTMHTLKEIYEAIPVITANTVKLGTSYLGIAGTLTPDGGTATTADLFSSKTANLTNDWTLDTGALNLACNTATFDGTGNKVGDAYDGGGNGTNRWCMTDSGDATSSDILTGKVAWVNGVAVSGIGSAGYTYGDSSAAKVLGTATGAGTALKDLFNGSNTANTFPGGSQANGGIDDYNSGGAAASGRYEKGWTQCTGGAVGNNYCGTGSDKADARDDSTGLVWSLPCKGSGCSSFSDTAPAMYSFDSSGLNNGGFTASQLCSNTTWHLPHQKQFMLAYANGAYGNLEASGVSLTRDYWIATASSTNTSNAWFANMSTGGFSSNAKTGSRFIRCVLFSPTN